MESFFFKCAKLNSTETLRVKTPVVRVNKFITGVGFCYLDNTGNLCCKKKKRTRDGLNCLTLAFISCFRPGLIPARLCGSRTAEISFPRVDPIVYSPCLRGILDSLHLCLSSEEQKWLQAKVRRPYLQNLTLLSLRKCKDITVTHATQTEQSQSTPLIKKRV